MEQSLKGHRSERDVRRRETSDAITRLQKTEVDVVRVADQVGGIRSELADIQSQIRERRNEVLDSAAKAGVADSATVQAEEKKTAKHRETVDAVERKTAGEQQKAEHVRPSDKRIKDGSGIAQVLANASAELKAINRDLQSIESGTRERRTKSSAHIDSAVRRNRK